MLAGLRRSAAAFSALQPVSPIKAALPRTWQPSFTLPLQASLALTATQGFPCQQVRAGGSRRLPPSAKLEQKSFFAPYPMVPYGVKKSATYKESKKSARKSAERARRAMEEKGMLLDPKKQLRMELKRNSGIGWYRSLQIIKHLEMHERGKGPPINQAMREHITQIAQTVRMGR
mmetsp:Transcript_16192/g.35481  ORF Transcript_16192/g.35481 Transcript_16192/m.35481 type:complete len:174 (-) Transcript_16192:70-591(-)